MRIVDRDRGYRALAERIFGFENPKVAVGILAADGEKRYEKGKTPATIADVAFWNEFGTENIPARPFIRGWMDQHGKEIQETMFKLMKLVLQGKIQKEQALEQLGLWMAGQIKAYMAEGVPPPNAESTIKAKGSSTPLIDTGVLRSSISHEVRK